MATIFTRIIEGEIPCYKVAEDSAHIAFLDINPIAPGHTLVVPKREVDYLFDLEPDELSALWVFARRVARRIGAKIPCNRVGVAVVGLDVPHAHIHLIPIDKGSDLDLGRPKLKLTSEEFEQIRSKLFSD